MDIFELYSYFEAGFFFLKEAVFYVAPVLHTLSQAITCYRNFRYLIENKNSKNSCEINRRSISVLSRAFEENRRIIAAGEDASLPITNFDKDYNPIGVIYRIYGKGGLTFGDGAAIEVVPPFTTGQITINDQIIA